MSDPNWALLNAVFFIASLVFLFVGIWSWSAYKPQVHPLVGAGFRSQLFSKSTLPLSGLQHKQQ
jgi:predicted small integral membrane protein